MYMAEKLLAQTSVTGATERTVPIEPDFQTDSVTIPVKLCNLPPLNSIANQVLSLTADPEVDLRRLAFAMEADPAFAAEVLLLANSSPNPGALDSTTNAERPRLPAASVRATTT